MRIDVNKSPTYIVLFAAVVSGAFTLAIMTMHAATRDAVARNERLLTEKALVDLFALGDVEKMSASEIAATVNNRIAGYRAAGDNPQVDKRREEIFIEDPQTKRRIQLLVAYKNDLPAGETPDIHNKAAILGYGFRVSGIGFWARIDGWLAVSPDLTHTLGVVFTQHSETPGLGGRITGREFRDQFRKSNGGGVKITPPTRGDRIIYIDREEPGSGDASAGRHVDAITGATGTSNAVSRFMNADIAAFRRAAEAAGLTATADAKAVE